MISASTQRLLRALRADARRYRELGGALSNLGFWAGATYRVGVWARSLPPPFKFGVSLPQRAIDAVWRIGFNVRISSDAEIGPGLCLIHPWSVVIGNCTIGDNCLIFHEVTLGTNANSENRSPTIGNNVDIYVGARVLGRVTLGDRVKVGANSVVVRSIPAGTTVAPPTSRTISAAAVSAFGARGRALRAQK